MVRTLPTGKVPVTARPARPRSGAGRNDGEVASIFFFFFPPPPPPPPPTPPPPPNHPPHVVLPKTAFEGPECFVEGRICGLRCP